MGMDVYGWNPTSKEGKYLYRNWTGWHALAALCCEVAPEESNPCKDWFTNDGDGLNAEESVRLACRLEEAMADGTVEKLIEDVSLEIPWVRRVLVPDNFNEFVTFLRACGGFSISGSVRISRPHLRTFADST